MTIVPRKEPEQDRTTVHLALSQRRLAQAVTPSLRGAPKTGAPLPIYRMTYRAARDTSSLTKARLVGWRYPIVGGEEPALASLIARRGTLHFAGISRGTFVHRLVEAANFAQRELAERPKKYEPRLLEIPSLRFYALWLYAPRHQSLVVMLSDNPDAASYTPQFESDIAQRISRAAGGSRPRERQTRL